MLIVVRHAEAGSKGSWAGPDLHRPGNVVLCTHGELIGRLFARLVPAGLAVEDPLLWPKGSAWLLWRTGRRLHARFVAPAGPRPAHLRQLTAQLFFFFLAAAFPPFLDASGVLAILAARSLDIPLSLSASYCFSFLTFADLDGISPSVVPRFLQPRFPEAHRPNRALTCVRLGVIFEKKGACRP